MRVSNGKISSRRRYIHTHQHLHTHTHTPTHTLLHVNKLSFGLSLSVSLFLSLTVSLSRIIFDLIYFVENAVFNRLFVASSAIEYLLLIQLLINIETLAFLKIVVLTRAYF